MQRSLARRFSQRPANAWMRARLERAIMELTRTWPGDELSVRAICARAGVGRHPATVAEKSRRGEHLRNTRQPSIYSRE